MTRNRRRTTASAASVELPAKVIDFFKAHPDEVLSARDVATKFGVAAAQVDTLLEATVESGQLKRQNTGQHGLVYMAAVRRAAFPEPSTERLRKAISAGRRARRAATRIDTARCLVDRLVTPCDRSRDAAVTCFGRAGAPASPPGPSLRPRGG